jgi:predicted enzyme related to lactoylglutathione lyase
MQRGILRRRGVEKVGGLKKPTPFATLMGRHVEAAFAMERPMQRCFTNILCADVDRTAGFYEELLGLHRHYTSDWFVILSHHDLPRLEVGLLQRDHAIVPEAVKAAPAGVMVTFVVDHCDAVHDAARAMGAEVLEPPTDMPYGQRRMLLRDPEGTVLDISAPIAAMR